MWFAVLPYGSTVPTGAPNAAYLLRDNWDDWFLYSTQYYLMYVDHARTLHEIGFVKIGEFDMGPDQRHANLPEAFEQLESKFFSLGQDETYYEGLKALGAEVISEILEAINDVALKEDTFVKALEEKVTRDSLLRSVTQKSVTGQFRRIINGGARVTEYSFEFRPPAQPFGEDLRLGFEVLPDSQPPTNIHVLIGRNGVGKTRVLQRMSQALSVSNPSSHYGDFIDRRDEKTGSLFANVVSVSFSAFDDFDPFTENVRTMGSIPYSYVGLKQKDPSMVDKAPPKSPEELGKEFSDSVAACLGGPRQERWRRALEMLEGDPIFNDAQIARVADDDDRHDEDLAARTGRLFRELSSGHKIVLLTITRLVQTLEEGSLVLLDEPEAHLHPPLLAAFTRVLSDLLKDRNGVAIIVTHSPVILQEVPRSNVWILRRTGRILKADRPRIETFGENVGILTREVFGLEAIQSGFHRLLGEAVNRGLSYEEILDSFAGQLGGEGRLIVQSLIALKQPSITPPFSEWKPNVES